MMWNHDDCMKTGARVDENDYWEVHRVGNQDALKIHPTYSGRLIKKNFQSMWDDSPGQYNTMCLHQSMCTLCQLERQVLGPQYHLKQNKQNISAKNSAQSYLVTANSAQSYSVTANPQVKVLCTATAWCQSDVITQWCILAYIWSWQHLCLLFSQGCFSRPSKRRRTIAPHSSCG